MVRLAAAAAILAFVGLSGASGFSRFWSARTQALAQGTAPRTASLTSPDGHITFELRTNPAGPLTYRIMRDGIAAVDWSPDGIAIDGRSFLDSPAVEILKNLQATWDETIVLPPSKIGEIAVMARRHGTEWFRAVVNGAGRRTVRITPSFLGPGRYTGVMAPAWCPVGSDPNPSRTRGIGV